MVSDPALGVGGLSSKGNARRQLILSAAIEVFAVQGFDGASIRDIATKAGISKGNLTYYFTVKDDLLYEIVNDLHDAFLGLAADPALTAMTPRDAFRLIAERHALLVCERRLQTRVSYEAFRYLSPERRRSVIDKRDLYEKFLRNLLKDGWPHLRRPSWRLPATTRTLLGTLNWAYQWYSPTGEMEPRQVATLVVDLAVRSLDA